MYGWCIVGTLSLIVLVAMFFLERKCMKYSWRESVFFGLYLLFVGLAFFGFLASSKQFFESREIIDYLPEQQKIYLEAIEQQDGIIETGLLNKIVETNKEITEMMISKKVYGKFSYYWNVPDSLLVPIDVRNK